MGLNVHLSLEKFRQVAGFLAAGAAVLAAGAPQRAEASQVQSGTYIDVYYNGNGLWVDPSVSRGLEIKSGGTTKAVTWPGAPWQQVTVEFNYGSSAYSYSGNYSSATWTTATESNLASGTTNKSYYKWTAGTLTIEKTEQWDDADKVMVITFKVTNNSTTGAVSTFRLMDAMDPDQDSSAGTSSTYNDVRDLDGNGKNDWAESAGVLSGWTVGYGYCDESKDDGGHDPYWGTDADTTFSDYAGASGDYTMHIRHKETSIPAGSNVSFNFLFVFDTTASAARTDYSAVRVTKCTGCADADSDGYASSTCGGTDCDDTDATINPGATESCNYKDDNCNGSVDEGATTTYYRDSDGDGYGDKTSTTSACTLPSGYTTNSTDCNDTDLSIHPSATETCNGIDDDCDGTIDEGAKTTYYKDADGDGYGDSATTTTGCSAPSGYVSNKSDCDDTSAKINPAATEVCDSKDNDCDGSVDEGVSYTYYKDADSDGYGDSKTTTTGCSTPSGYTTDSTDCDDTAKTVHPGATETCNAVDDDCDGSVDEGVKTTYYKDADGDGYGTSSTSTTACSAPSGYVTSSTDCNDADKAVNPGATEVCNGKDDDCDGATDEAVTSTYYRDADGDGYGTSASTTTGCSAPSGYVSNSTDCDDGNASVSPAASEICNAVDDDCDGSIDEGVRSTWYADYDSDGYGDKTLSTTSCSAPSGYVADATDCDDTDPTVSPAGTEVCDGVDNDCNGLVDEVGGVPFYADTDADGYGDPSSTVDGCSAPSGYTSDSSDCDDTASTIHPGAVEHCNGKDDDCDGSVDEGAIDGTAWYADMDSDGYGDPLVSTTSCTAPAGYVAANTDCDDTTALISPAATEACNGVDDDCDGTIDESGATGASTWYADTDSDTYGDVTSTASACTQPKGYVADATDCDDTSATVHPGATEIPYDGIDQDCDGLDVDDADGDGYVGVGGGGDDCDDFDASVYPGAAESADGIDGNCDGVVDETTDWADDDGDGYTESGGDCDDGDATVGPFATEACNGVDDDCDGKIDEGAHCSDVDDDGDGYTPDTGDCNDGDKDVNPGETEVDDNGIDDDCDGSVDGGVYDPDSDGYAASTDCEPDDAASHPGAAEVEDGIDNDCDGLVDEGTAATDDDGDGASEEDGDCNDNDPDVGPSAAEVGANGVDDDCDGVVDQGTALTDDDGDGYSEEQGDCDDTNADVGPLGTEVENGVDDDCDGEIDDGLEDLDQDGYRVADGDCDDADGWANPGATEECDGVDNDCDGGVDEDLLCDGDTGSLTDTEKGCGCDTEAGGSAGVPWMVLALAAWRRRRSANKRP